MVAKKRALKKKAIKKKIKVNTTLQRSPEDLKKENYLNNKDNFLKVIKKLKPSSKKKSTKNGFPEPGPTKA